MNEVRELFERLASVEPVASALEILEGAEHRAGHLRRRRTRHMFATIGAITAAAVVVGIVIVTTRTTGGRNGVHVSVTPTTTTAPPAPTAVGVPRYSVDATVLQNAAHGPQLCLSVADSLPPQCGGTPIVGWDWTKVAKKETMHSVTWGDYHLVGAYDGKTFTITEPPTAPHPPRSFALPSFTTPCPTPPGGWVVVDRSHFSIDDYNAFSTAAQDQPDSAGMWVDSTTPVDGAVNLSPETVMTVAFTGNLDVHRAQLRALWGGPICVVQRPHSTAELHLIAQALSGAVGTQLGLHVEYALTDAVNNRVELSALVATPAEQRQLDEKYGSGVVHLTGVFTQVP